MEALNQKSLERVVSRRALQMGSSFPCQICVVGFLCGVCLTSLFLAALTSFGSFHFGGISFSSISMGAPPGNLSSEIISDVTSTDCKFKLKETERRVDSCRNEREVEDERVSLLYSAWGALLTKSVIEEREFSKRFGLERSSVPNAPHFEDCKLSARVNTRLDARALRMGTSRLGQVGRDYWTCIPHLQPMNKLNILGIVPFRKVLILLLGLGIGRGTIAGMCGLLAIAINEKRVLVTNYFNRADHDGCKGSSRSSWSCYFFPETSQECRDRAFDLMGSKEALEKGIITTKDNYTSKAIWAGRTPRQVITCLTNLFLKTLTQLPLEAINSLMSISITGYGVNRGVICSQQQK
ncbi:hypothetical protein Patl1_23145 [Pistacia atlantica]|uniref:Uncharacterized protein n=1 Tax=Pistacia atlantica TaxID=434234 RepID=A0ACC1A1B7_9ROSI|nr:hypothetical protein Patl1_23145 [Pistacia atlantica]